MTETQINFLKAQWKLGKIDEAYLDALISKNRITQEQKAEITRAS